MSLPLSRLPQRATVYYQDNTPDDYGDISADWTELYVSVPCRKVNNEHFNSDAQHEAGYLSKSTHLVFMNLSYSSYSNLLIKTGYKIVIDGEDYIVQYADRAPGGKANYHQQIYVNHMLTDIA